MAAELRRQVRRHISQTRERAEETMNEHSALLRNTLARPNGAPLDKDERPWVRWPAHVAHVTWLTLKSNPIHFLLFFVPLGIVAGAAGWNPTAVFVLNFFAIVPLASLLSFATEEVSAKLGQTMGGLLNASFGNAVELIVAIAALLKGEIRIVQSSMLGSILSNVLLVLGCCFLAGGIRWRPEQGFNTTAAQTMSSLMAVASASLIIPSTLYAVTAGSKADNDGNILILSHGTSIILLILYMLYLFFQLRTHKELFQEGKAVRSEGHRRERDGLPDQRDAENGVAREGAEGSGDEEEEEEEEEHILSPIAAGIALVVVTVMVAVCAEYLVDSIDSIVETAHVSRTFVGLILLPIVGNAAEHVTAVVVSYKDKMDLAIGVAVGSSLQIALFVTPAMVIIGWIVGQPMTLHFETFETVVFFLSMLVVNYLIQDGKSNYLEGAMLIGTYVIIALAFYVYPDDASTHLALGGVA